MSFDYHPSRRSQPDGLILVGASVRAAAMSARRAGLSVWGADLFADEDLRQIGDARRIERYPEQLVELLEQAPPWPWMYTGAIENHRRLIDQLAMIRPLFGVQGESLRAARDPFTWSAVVCEAGLRAPRCLPLNAIGEGLAAIGEARREGAWLIKPLASAGGMNIRPADRAAVGEILGAGADERHFLQEYVHGRSFGAVYVADGADCRLLGVTRQILAPEWLAQDLATQHPLRYCGSISPVRLSAADTEMYKRLGAAVADLLQLRGLFGIDTVRTPAGEIVPVEINPRYTASIEVLERATGESAIAQHIAAFGGESCAVRNTNSDQCVGKAIVFATEECVAGDRFAAWVAKRNAGAAAPAVADIPASGAVFRAGWPVVTVFAMAPNEESVLHELRRLRDEVFTRVAS